MENKYTPEQEKLAEQCLRDIENVRAKVISRMPLFTKMMIDLPTELDFDIPTLNTNGERIKINPEFWNGRAPNTKVTDYLHELAHNWLDHPSRVRKGWDRDTAQEAVDFAANSMLRQCGVPIPSDYLYDMKYDGMAMEEIYGALYQDKQRQPQLYGKNQFDPNKHGETEPNPDNPSEGDTPEEAQEKEQRLKKKQKDHQEMVLESVQSARIMGELPEYVERMLDKIIKVESNFEDIFAEYMQICAGRDDYSYTKPNPRYNGDFIMPGLYSEEIEDIVLIGDTSGSVGKDDMRNMCGRILSLVDDLHPEHLTVIWCDSRVQGVEEYEQGEEPDLNPKGGGGTSFIPPFAEIEKMSLDPVFVVYLTDGYCNRFPEEPPYPVIWVVWQDLHTFRPPFGEVVVMPPEK